MVTTGYSAADWISSSAMSRVITKQEYDVSVKMAN
jgi:hypothetical protein